MKSTSKIARLFGILFLVGGLGIIIAVFFLFLKGIQEEKLFYLNLVATCLVYTVILLRAGDIFGSVEKVAQNSSGYGLKWTAVWIYVPLALGLIVCSILMELGFALCLIGHLVLLFGLLLLFFLGNLVKTNVNSVVGNIEARKAGLKEINTQIDLLEMHNKLVGGNAYQEAIDKLREGVRFITASDKPAAVALEGKLLEKVRLISFQVENNSQPADVINAEFAECMSIIELRKNQY